MKSNFHEKKGDFSLEDLSMENYSSPVLPQSTQGSTGEAVRRLMTEITQLGRTLFLYFSFFAFSHKRYFNLCSTCDGRSFQRKTLPIVLYGFSLITIFYKENLV